MWTATLSNPFASDIMIGGELNAAIIVPCEAKRDTECARSRG